MRQVRDACYYVSNPKVYWEDGWDIVRNYGEFVEYIEMMRQLDLEVAGEFLVMAATLMYIKSRELLPADQQPALEEDEEEDPRWELIRQLVEYRKFKDAAVGLQALELEQERIYRRQPGRPDLEPAAPSSGGAEASLFDLLSAVSQVLKRFQAQESPREIFEDKWSVSEKIEHLQSLMTQGRPVRFSELFAATTSRSEVVVTFLALLELIRLRLVLAVQEELFGEIEIRSHAAGGERSSLNGGKLTDAVDSPAALQSHGTETRH